MTNFTNSYNKFVLGLEQINEAAAKYPEEFVDKTEQMFASEVSCVADYIRDKKCRVLMLAGPSGSGKTTTAYKIGEELEKRGSRAVIISLDDFYLGENKAPLMKDGQYDYEAVEALDIENVKECLKGLMQTGECFAPKFNFKTKSPEIKKEHIKLYKDDVAIVEGIHGLNPIFTKSLPKDGLLKAYISVKQGIKDFNGPILSRRDIRLVRRLVRDSHARETDAEETLSMWDNVGRGELLYIHPFKRTSDITINSIHMYEICVLCSTAAKLLKTVSNDSANFKLAKHVLSGIERFYPIDEKYVPKNSLIREFIGGGIY